MSRRKKTPEAQEAAPEVAAPDAAPETGLVTLTLKQCDYVGGVKYPAGTSFPFSKSEARRRLATQRFWLPATV